MSERDNNNGRYSEELFSKSVRAGKRTYFFDVRSTKGNDYYLTITESKKKFLSNDPDGKAIFEKHKIFLYKEDFSKFIEGLNIAIAEIRKVQPFDEDAYRAANQHHENHSDEATEDVPAPKDESSFTNIDFDDLK